MTFFRCSWGLVAGVVLGGGVCSWSALGLMGVTRMEDFRFGSSGKGTNGVRFGVGSAGLGVSVVEKYLLLIVNLVYSSTVFGR